MELAAMENAGASSDSMRKFIGRGRARKAQIDGELANRVAVTRCANYFGDSHHNLEITLNRDSEYIK